MFRQMLETLLNPPMAVTVVSVDSKTFHNYKKLVYNPPASSSSTITAYAFEALIRLGSISGFVAIASYLIEFDYSET